jgi:ABC-2 type transport system permease protein
MISLARNELYRLFLSPLAWVILALTQLILAYLFLSHVDYFLSFQSQLVTIPGAPGVTELVATMLLNNAALILLLITPLITMRLIAEERQNGTLPLLFSAPLSMSALVIGKFLGTFAFFIILLCMVSLMPLSLALGSHLDYGQLAAGLLGLVLLVASFTAVGLYFSSLTKQPIIAAISTFASLFLLWLFSSNSSDGASVLNWFAIPTHLNPLLQGDVNTSDIAYFLLLTGLCLILTIRHLNSMRLSS